MILLTPLWSDTPLFRMVSSPFPFSVIARAGPCLVGSRSVNFVESLI